MGRRLRCSIVTTLALATCLSSGCGKSGGAGRSSATHEGAGGGARDAFVVESPSFAPGGMLPTSAAFDGSGCGGGNRSPRLFLRGTPEGTKSFVVLLHDPNAPGARGFDHWVVFDLPGTTTELAEGDDPRRLGAHLGRNDFGTVGYGGPCPPPGPSHRYVFTFHALDVPALGLEDGARASDVRARLEGHELARASLEGRFAR